MLIYLNRLVRIVWGRPVILVGRVEVVEAEQDRGHYGQRSPGVSLHRFADAPFGRMRRAAEVGRKKRLPRSRSAGKRGVVSGLLPLTFHDAVDRELECLDRLGPRQAGETLLS